MRINHGAADGCESFQGMTKLLNSGLEGIDPPLGATDAEISAAVAEMGLLPLVMSSVHMTGRMDIVRSLGQTRPPQFSADASGSIPEQQAAAVRASVIDVIRTWRDAGCPTPYRPSEPEIREMIDVLAGKALSPRYTPLLTEELGFEGDARAFEWERLPPAPAKAEYPVLIIGAGLAGIVMGYRLKQAGIPFTIVEKNSGPGGTWFENRYPGARVDIPSHCYSFSFLRRQRWPELFSPAPVLRAYFETCIDDLSLRQQVRYGLEALRARYEARDHNWEVTLKSATGEEVLRVRAVVSAVGQLNRPLIPEIPGREIFGGRCLHTSRWTEDLNVDGRKVAVIGTAATALQVIPELAKTAEKLVVFQRSPTWVYVHPQYRRTIRRGEQWAMDHLPGYADWYRVLLYNWAGDGAADHMRIDPNWKQEGSVSAANEAQRVRLTKGMMEAIGHNSTLAAKVIPTYPPGVKRPNLGDGGYFRALTNENVELVTDGVARFTETGLMDGAGRHHDADIVVFATGFRALEYLAPMEIVGRGGRRLDQFWQDDPGAYLGMTVPHFPNFFLMYGPGTNLGYNGNLFFNAECQAGYIAGCIRWMVEDQLEALEVKSQVYVEYASRMQEALLNYTWSHSGAGSWYKNKAGKVVANSPWPLIDYWEWTRRPNPADFNITPPPHRR
jgi:4-hydroxyacetophenone monooxygenase